VIVATGLMQVTLATAAGTECVGSLLDCAGENPVELITLLILSLVFSGVAGGLLALVWQLGVRAATGATRRRARRGAPGAGARSGLPAGGPRPGWVAASMQIGPAPAMGRVIAGPVWTDGHWLRMVASNRGGQRVEVLEADGWKPSDHDIGRLVAEALAIGPRPRP
jgi:hypothetical protein